MCILGRGTTLGRPLALLLTQKRPTANAAVTVVHTGVPDWPEHTRRAEIVKSSAGWERGRLVTVEMGYSTAASRVS